MHSHLTRRVFRRLLSSQPLVPLRHIHHPSRIRPLARHGRHGRIAVNVAATRTFFGLFQEKRRDVRTPRLDPGMEKMLELDKRINLIARLPPGKDLADAFNTFFASKAGRSATIEDYHAAQVLQTLQTLEKMTEEAKQQGQPAFLSVDELDFALRSMTKHLENPTKLHNELARALVRNAEGEPSSPARAVTRLQDLVTVLCNTGDSLYARTLVEEFWRINIPPRSEDAPELWSRVLRGFAKEDNETEITNTLKIMQSLEVGRTNVARRTLVSFYASKDNVQETKLWASREAFKPDDANPWSPASDFRVLLEFCLRNQELEWGEQFLEAEIDPSNPRTWDFVLGAAAAIGKSVDEINRMMEVLSRRSREVAGDGVKPNIGTFNNLIRFAISKNDPYTAERYFNLAQKWEATPDSETYILQIRYRLNAGDLSGAMASWEQLQEEEIEKDQDWLIVNEMVRTFTQSTQISNETVMTLIGDLTQRGKVFPPETVHALCNYHLKRDEYFEVVDLLQTYSYQYSSAERIKIRDVLASYTFDFNNDLGRAWDTFMIFHQTFDAETKRDLRNKAMTLFFQRGRPDLATHIFTAMSRHMRADTRPDLETYILALEGIGTTGDPEALEVIHNLLKLDTEIEPCTRLHNALMIAYTACERPRRALEFWSEVARSREGPTYESLLIAMRACEVEPLGHPVARAIWARLRKTDIVITRELYIAYVGALGGGQQYEEVADKVIPQMEEVCGEKPDFEVIATFYNTALDSKNQERMEQWAKENYPDIWKEMEDKGFGENDLGLQRVNGLDRTLKA